MIKLNRHHVMQIIAWAACFIILLVIILIPKYEILYKILGYVFFIVFFIAPPILLIIHLVPYVKMRIEENDRLTIIPIIGFFLFEALAFIYFIASLNEVGKQIMIWVLIGTFLYNVIASVVLVYPKKYCIKRHLIATILALVLFIVFFGVGIYASYEYSIMW